MLQKHLFSVTLILNAAIAYSQTDLSYPSEKKIDYLEKIYFSGGNKQALTDTIDIYVSRMSRRFDSSIVPSPEYLKQFVFLQKIQPHLANTKDACDVLDLLAVGIRELDFEEAMMQKIKKPSADAVNNSADALPGISKVNNAVSTTSDALNTLAWANYYRSGKAVGFGATSSIAGAADMLGTGLEVAKQGKQIADAIGMFKGGKDKSCKEVEKKEIILGQHKFTPALTPATAIQTTTVAAAQTATTEKTAQGAATMVTINNISFSQLSTLLDLVKKMDDVQSVSSESFANNVAILKVSHGLALNDLLMNMTRLTSSVKLEVSASDAKTNSGTLKCKS